MSQSLYPHILAKKGLTLLEEEFWIKDMQANLVLGLNQQSHIRNILFNLLQDRPNDGKEILAHLTQQIFPIGSKKLAILKSGLQLGNKQLESIQEFNL